MIADIATGIAVALVLLCLVVGLLSLACHITAWIVFHPSLCRRHRSDGRDG